MANGVAESFIGGRGAALQQRGQQQALSQGAQRFGLQQQQGGLQLQRQRQEIDRFTEEGNLKSMVQGALEFKSITDPIKQELFLNKRLADITARGGDATDTLELLNTPPEERGAVVDNVIGIGERMGIIEATKQPTPAKLTAGVIPGVGSVFLRQNEAGELEEVKGGKPPASRGEVITIGPNGTTISRGVSASPALPKKIVRDLSTSIINNEQNLSRLDRIGDQFRPGFLTYLGRAGATLSSLKSKAGIDLKPEDRKFLQNRRKFTQNINQLFNAYRKEITGAAASVQELESLKKAMLSEDLSPAEFEASFDEFRSELQRANRLSRRVLREGLPGKFGKNLDTLFTSGEDDDSEARGMELIGQGLTEEQALDKLESEGY